MERAYKIGGQTVTLRASLYTQIAYKSFFGRDIFADLHKAAVLNELYSDTKDVGEQAEIMHEINVIYLQALWVLVREGTPDTPTFTEWLKSIDGFDMPDVITTVTELYTSTLHPDRKNG